jgi:hypothetical protein
MATPGHSHVKGDDPIPTPGKFKDFLRVSQNKKALLALMKSVVAAGATQGMQLITSGAIGMEETAPQVTEVYLLESGEGSVTSAALAGGYSPVVSAEGLSCKLEEADQGIIATCKWAVEMLKCDVIVDVQDTDVHVAMVSYAGLIAGGVVLGAISGKDTERRTYDVHATRATLAAAHGEKFAKCLVGLHVLSGCDTTSALFRKGKVTWWKKVVQLCGQTRPQPTPAAAVSDASSMGTAGPNHMRRCMEIVDALISLGDAGFEESTGVLCQGRVLAPLERLACMIYNADDEDSLLTPRSGGWKQGQANPPSLAPSPGGWLEHVLRSHLQCKIWRASLSGEGQPDPRGWGWQDCASGGLEPVPSKNPRAPAILDKKLTCGCSHKGNCKSKSCGCRKGAHLCGDLCSCPPDCANRETSSTTDAFDEVDEYLAEIAIAAERGALGDTLEGEDEEEGQCDACSSTGWDQTAGTHCTECTQGEA